jgi:tRNA G18 (ribose-2'-O)-methylase SpoU
MAVADGGQCATETTFERPMAVVIGSEEKGIDEKVQAHGTLVTLPQRDTSSYNASVAAGIFLFLTHFNKG